MGAGVRLSWTETQLCLSSDQLLGEPVAPPVNEAVGKQNEILCVRQARLVHRRLAQGLACSLGSISVSF